MKNLDLKREGADDTAPRTRACPECGFVVRVNGAGELVDQCEHVVRVWQVAKGDRVRVAFSAKPVTALHWGGGELGRGLFG
jgi:FtsP/CotA-like multicopper oxidase with cupredoxin domain